MSSKWNKTEQPGKKNIFFENPCGFNGSVNISENCDFQSPFEPSYIIFLPFILNTFLLAYTFWIKKYKINKSVSLKSVEL